MRCISKEDFFKQDKEFEIKKEIEDALANKKIVTYIQPIFDVKKKKFTCGECLCRIKKEDGELMMPSNFVGVAEKYGLICNIETEMFKNQLTLDDYGYVISDETTKTNLEGVFAVGDVRTKNVRQIVTATADGAVAAHFIEEFLN